MVKDDRWQSIFTWAEQPHKRICLGISFRLPQYLDSCLICYEVFPLKELPVKIIIHRPEIIIRTIYDSIGKCCPVKIHSKQMPILLLFRYSYYTIKSIEKEAEMPVFSRLHYVLNALGCSISRPDISQSNCCHVSWRTSWLERSQRKLPFTSMRLYRSTKPSFSHRSTFTQSQYKARRQLLYRLAWKLRKYLDCFGKKQWIRFVWNAQIHVSNH